MVGDFNEEDSSSQRSDGSYLQQNNEKKQYVLQSKLVKNPMGPGSFPCSCVLYYIL